MHQFIKDYFKDNYDAIKLLHDKINDVNKTINKTNNKSFSDFTIHYEDNDFFAIKDNDLSSAKHLSLFDILEIMEMKLASNVNKTMIEEFILSII